MTGQVLLTWHERRLTGRYDAPAAVARLCASGLLGEHVAYERDGRFIVGGRAVGAVTVTRGAITSTFAEPEPWSVRPWPGIARALARCPVPGWSALGWACFELASPALPAGPGPLLQLMVPGLEVHLDAAGARIRSLDPEAMDGVAAVLAATPAPAATPTPVDVTGDAAGYRLGVARAVAEIRRGRLDKVILSRTVPVGFPVDLPATYALGRAANTPARSFLLDLGGWEAAGFSPESVVEVDTAGTASTQPLAGTTARTADPAGDAARRVALLADPKEVFEHATSVKLAFEEMESVAAPGTTRISEFLAVQQRGSVQHLGSRVVAELDGARGPWDALGAVFPAVTASGIPKAPALDLITELEDGPRGLYAGAVLCAGADGGLDAALVLRAIYRHAGRSWLRAGAGLVRASRPEREYAETCEKLASVAPYVVAARTVG